MADKPKVKRPSGRVIPMARHQALLDNHMTSDLPPMDPHLVAPQTPIVMRPGGNFQTMQHHNDLMDYRTAYDLPPSESTYLAKLLGLSK